MNTLNISRKLLKTASIGILATSLANISQASDTAAPAQLGADEAYVLVKVKDRSRTLSSFSLTEAGSKIKLKLGDQGSMQLLKVKAGTYVASVGDNQGKKGIRVAPGTVTYIGDWTLNGADEIRVNGKLFTASNENISIHYSVDNLFDFAEQNQWVTKYPLHISNTNGKRVANNWVQAQQRS